MPPSWRHSAAILRLGGAAFSASACRAAARPPSASLALAVAGRGSAALGLNSSRGFSSGTAISAALVKELRERTGASMGKCREALCEEGGDLEKAVEWLRRRGIRSMERRTAEAGEALLALGMSENGGAIVELRAETDFVTRGELFQHLCLCLAQTAARKGLASSAELLEAPVESELRPKQVSEGAVVSAALLEMGSVVGERLMLADAQHLAAPPGGVMAGYVHPKQADGQGGTGRVASLVALRPSPDSKCDRERLQAAASQLARHVVAMQPRFVSIESVPADVLQKERDTLRAAHLEQLGSKKEPDENILKKVLDGKMQKFYQENVLLCQDFIAPQAAEADGAEPKAVPVAEWLKAEAASLGLDSLTVEGFRLARL